MMTAPAALVCGLACTLTLSLGCSTDPGSSVPTQQVERRTFVQRVTVEGQLEAANSTQLTVPMDVQQRVRLAWVESEGKKIEAGDVVARFDAKAMQRQLEDSRGEHRSTELKIDKTRIESSIEVSRLSTELAISDLELEHARSFQKVDSDVFARRDILQDAIDGELATARKEHAEKATGTQQQLAQTELDLLTIRQRQAQLKIDRARNALETLEIRSPHAGILQLARNWRGEPPRAGAEMWRGQSIGEIPDLETLQAKVYVLEADAGGLAEGKPAEVTVEAHPETTYAATIRSIEALAKPRIPGSPVQYFGVVLALETTAIGIMKPGSRVRATLHLEERDDALVLPRQAIFQQEGTSRVYVRSASGFGLRDVEVGPTSLGWVVIDSGLSEGDVVALAEPATVVQQVSEVETSETAGTLGSTGTPETTAANPSEIPSSTPLTDSGS